jgi:hypothetical protein
VTVDLVRDVLDKQVFGPEDRPLGRVDGIVAELGEDGSPRLVAIELGGTTLAARLHELLLGTRVVDATGRVVGRIEEFRAEQRGGDWIVTEYVVGVAGLAERLAASRIARWLFRRVGRVRDAWTIPSTALDLGDPRRPRLRGPAVAGTADGPRLTPSESGG